METPKPHQAYEWYNLLVARSLVPETLLLAGVETCLGQAFYTESQSIGDTGVSPMQARAKCPWPRD